MGKELAALYPVAKETFDEADDALGLQAFATLLRRSRRQT